MSLPSLNAVQDHFLRVFDLGRGALTNDVQALFHIFVTLEIIFAGLYIALGSRADFSELAQKILKIGTFYWIITRYEELLNALLDGFLNVGTKASGATGLNIATLQNPDAIIERAFKIVTPAFEKVFALQGENYLGLPTLDNILVLFCVSIGFLALISLALQVFLTYVEFMVIAAAGFILVPFGLFKPLQFLSEKFFAAVVSMGIKLLVLAVIIGASTSIMDEMVLSHVLSWQEVWNFLLVSLALFLISFHAPSLAQSLLYGTPSLTAGLIAPAIYGSASQLTAASSKAIKYGGVTPAKNAIAGVGMAHGAYNKASENSSSKTAAILYGTPKNFASAMQRATVGPVASKARAVYQYGKTLGGSK